MRDFMPDPMFQQRAVIAIRRLEHLVETEPRANHRLDRLVADLEAVFKRYVRGEHCFTCNAHATLPMIPHVVFCGNEKCRHLVEERSAETEQRIQEAVEEGGYAK